MLIDYLVCHLDGTQEKVTRDEEITPPEPEISTEELTLEMLADHEERICLIEMGVL